MSDPFLAVRAHFQSHAAYFQDNHDALMQGEPATPTNVFQWLKEFFEQGTIFIADKSYGAFANDFKYRHTQHLDYSYTDAEDGVKTHFLQAYDGRQGGHSLGLCIELNPDDSLSIFYGHEEGSLYKGNRETFDVSSYSRDQAVAELFKKLAGERQYWPFGAIFQDIKKFVTQPPALTK